MFDVSVQGSTFPKGLDIVKEIGGPWRTSVKELRGIEVRGDLTVTLTPSKAVSGRPPALSDFEVQAEGW